MPNLPDGHLDELPPSARRLRQMFGLDGDWTDDEIARARAAYFGLCTYLDDKIGFLMDTLEEQGLAENTVIVHTSDHGDMLGEHGLWRKMSFYEQSANVPLQISWPGNFKKGLRIGEAVSNVDAVATILDLAGVKLDKGDLDGQSLIQLYMATHQDLMMLRYANILPTVRPTYGHGTVREMETLLRAWQPSGN
ncbi:MAG: hypothetical protein CM1200mP39_26590 [Dehalococcoidia bacterium]|nr:MAG: hypothetical protein CM1200mP39_26590 [Dehalococcoidia bacterium]